MMSAVQALQSIDEAIRGRGRGWAYICIDRDGGANSYLVSYGEDPEDCPDDGSFEVRGCRVFFDDIAVANLLGAALAEIAEEYDL